MTQIEVTVQRETLDDDFKLTEQKIDCIENLKYEVFTAIEGAVNATCKDKEAFTVKAIVSINQYLFVTGAYAKQCHKVVLEQIKSFSGDNLVNLKEPIELKI